MKNLIKNWKSILFALFLLGLLALPLAAQPARAQSDCTDPASGLPCTPTPPAGCFDVFGAPCTPTPPPPTCGLPGLPPCNTPAPPEPTNPPAPTRTPRPTAMPTRTPTATPTSTPAATLPPRQTLPAPETPTVVYLPTLPPRATLLPGITPQPTQASDVALAPIQNPVPVTPKSNNGPLWGSIVNWFKQLVKTFVPSDDLLWLTRVNVVHASGYYCIGGPMCPSEKVPLGYAIKVLIMPDGVVAPEVLNGKEQDFYPVLCRGKTGQKGCSEFVTGQRPGPKGQWLLDNTYKYPKSLPGVYEFDLPSSWVSGAGTYTFTAYINYNQQAFSEDYSNNFITFQFTIEGDPSLSMSPLARWLPDNVYYFDPSTFVVLQGENCVLGCAQTTNGAVNAGVPVEVYTRALGNPFKLPNPDLIFYEYVSDPTQAAMFACKGSASQNGCAEPFAADTPPYAIPQWFLDSPDASLLNDPYRPLIRFTIPGDKISKSGVYKFTFYVNYLQQASAEKKLSDNVRFFYLQVFP